MRVLILTALLFITSMAQTATQECSFCRCSTSGDRDIRTDLAGCVSEAVADGVSYFTWRSDNRCQIPASDDSCLGDLRNTGTTREWGIYKIQGATGFTEKISNRNLGDPCGTINGVLVPCGEGEFCDYNLVSTGECKACQTGCLNDSDLSTEGAIECYNLCEANQMLVTLPGCSSASPCDTCQGTCASDDDCAEGLTCLQRAAGDAISGCIFPVYNEDEGITNTNFPDSGQSVCYDTSASDSNSGYQQDGYILPLFSTTPCNLIENDQVQACSGATADNPCERSFCADTTAGPRCKVEGLEIGTPCTFTQGQVGSGSEITEVAGVCVDGQCVWNQNAECPSGTFSAERVAPSCGDQNFQRTWRFQGLECPKTGSTCDDFGPVVSELNCWTSAAKGSDSVEFQVNYHDPNDVDAARDGHEWGKCIVGQTADCVMNQPGFYTYRTMDIYWTVGSNDNEDFTVLNIPLTQKTLAPVMHCPDGEWCRGTIDCSMIGSQPCSRTLTTCDGTAPPTASPIEPPTLDPTLDPTQSPTGPTDPPTSSPTKFPSREPTNSPTRDPLTPTNSPTRTPTVNPTTSPSKTPSKHPSSNPTPPPTHFPSFHPTSDPSKNPSKDPSFHPTSDPSKTPSKDPSFHPTVNPSKNPSKDPSSHPSSNPTKVPSKNPSNDPTFHPSSDPTKFPSKNPSFQPSSNPTKFPSKNPSFHPSSNPTKFPSKNPSRDPTGIPTRFPSFHPTSNPSNFPSFHPTANPTLEPTAASHGDPIIWTFFGECYDLNKDGIYLATSHPQINHDVYIAVYNDYMREIQIQDKNGDILLSVSNLGEVVNNWPYRFTEELKKCPPEEYCNLFYKEFTFDAQQFRFVVQVLPHNYLDPALKAGEEGVHLDIFPRPYQGFTEQKHVYEGLYFSNPLPEILEYCPGGSQRHRS